MTQPALIHVGGPKGCPRYALVDPEDLARVSGFRWYSMHTHRRTASGELLRTHTAYRDTAQGRTYLHRQIAGAGPQSTVTHNNGNGLDCRRANLTVTNADTH